MWTGSTGENSGTGNVTGNLQVWEKDVVLTGNLNRIEVWSKAKWSENNDYDDMDAIAEDMQEMGIII